MNKTINFENLSSAIEHFEDSFKKTDEIMSKYSDENLRDACLKQKENILIALEALDIIKKMFFSKNENIKPQSKNDETIKILKEIKENNRKFIVHSARGGKFYSPEFITKIVIWNMALENAIEELSGDKQ